MKKKKSICNNFLIPFSLSFCFLLSFNCFSQFVHPGILHDSDELDFVKQQIEKKNEPWLSLFEDLQNSEYGQLSRTTKAFEEINVGYHGKPKIGGNEFMSDGDAAYTMALLWYFTSDTVYALKSISIINNWSYKLNSIVNKNRKLVTGISGIKYLTAAEIIKHTYDNWNFIDQQKFEEMVMSVWYPIIEDFGPTYNGNWDAAMVQTMLAIGIYFDSDEIFNRAYIYILNGESNGAISNYISAAYGQCQESGRDQIHVQMGLGYLATICEIAWKQGFDLYYAHSNRLALGYEYTSKYMLGEQVEYKKFVSFKGKTMFGEQISPTGRDKPIAIFERAYRHYYHRKGLNMPYTHAIIDKYGQMNTGGAMMPWSSLMNQPIKKKN